MTRSLSMWLLSLAVVVAALAWGRSAMASPPRVQTRVIPETTEVGGTVRVEVEASSSDDRPESTTLSLPPGFTLLSQQHGSSQHVSIINGRMTRELGLHSTFILRAGNKEGRFLIIPRVTVGGIVHGSSGATVRVGPPGSAPARPTPIPRAFDPFSGLDPFGGHDPFSDLFGQQGGSTEPSVTIDPKWSLTRAPASDAFLRATVDRTRAFVGQQVTLTIYLYTRADRHEPDFSDIHEATAPEFVRRVLASPDEPPVLGYGRAGKWLFRVQMVRKFALFPIHAGKLAIGPMRVSVGSPGKVPAPRESEHFDIDAIDPPATGRPATFASGSVGSFQLEASVDPRVTSVGDAVGVTLHLTGWGNFPNALRLPTRAATEWLPPERSDDLGERENGRFGGRRTWKHVVRTRQGGKIGLGSIAFTFFDPGKGAYRTTEVDLGDLSVSGHAVDAGAGDPSRALMAALGAPRTELTGARAPARPVIRGKTFWLLLAAGPLLILLGSAVGRTRKRLADRQARRHADPNEAATLALRRAIASSKSDDARAIDADTIRALFAHAHARTGKQLVGGTKDERLRALGDADVDAHIVAEFLELIEACEGARYAPDASSPDEAKKRLDRAERVCGALAAGRRGKPRSKEEAS